MRKIYLVKKNPEQPADGNNWSLGTSFRPRKGRNEEIALGS